MANKSSDTISWVGLALKQTKLLLDLLVNGTINQIFPTVFAGREYRIIEIIFSPVKIEFTYDPHDDTSTQLSIISSLQKFMVEGVPIIQETMLVEAILNMIKAGTATTIITEMYNGICELIETIDDLSQEDLNLEKEKLVRVRQPDGSFEFVEMPIKSNQIKVEQFCNTVKFNLEDLDVHRFLTNCDQLVRHTNNMRIRTAKEWSEQIASLKRANERESKKRRLNETNVNKTVKKERNVD